MERARIHAKILINKYHESFELVNKLHCRGGLCFKNIYTATGVKVGIRGRNQGYLEVNGTEEAPEQLQVCWSTRAVHEAEFREAANLLVQMLTDMEELYRQFCNEHGLTHENPLFSFGEVSKGCEVLLSDLIVRYPPLRV